MAATTPARNSPAMRQHYNTGKHVRKDLLCKKELSSVISGAADGPGSEPASEIPIHTINQKPGLTESRLLCEVASGLFSA